MTKLNVYLNFPGNAEEAFSFYKAVFGGEFSSLVRYKDMPMAGVKIAQKDENKLMHIALPVGKDDLLMASDALESMGQKVVKGSDVILSLHPESKEEADRLFKELSAGGKVEMPMAKQIWGDYYGSFTDKYGVRWMVNYAVPKT
jgi:PhnB protein